MIRPKNEMTVEIREKMRGGPGSVTIRHMFKPAEFKAPVRLCGRLILPPGTGIGLHEHASEDEVYVIVSGEGMVDEGLGEKPVRAGDAVLTGRGASHSIRNSGVEPLEMIAFITTYPS